MPKRTQLFQQLPWSGGVNTAQDQGLIAPNQLTRADNVLFETRASKKPRGGFDYTWDSTEIDETAIYGLHEFWFGVDSRQRLFVSLNTSGDMRSYTAGGIASDITVEGSDWTGILDQVSMLTFNNRLITAVNGTDNLVKVWNGTGSATDLKNALNQRLATNGRSSSGTTRTLVLTAKFKGVVGDLVVVSNASANAEFYNGTHEVTAVTTTNVTDDTISYVGDGTLNEVGTTDLNLTVDGVAPKASILREHLGRIWCNDKENKDRLHYSAPFDHEKWLGFGDSGALDIGVGDGDPEGITAIFPSFKGELFVAKRTKLYRIRGFSADSFQIELVTSGIGCVSHSACTLVDQDDLYFVSEKGVHSIIATQNFGDFNSKFISKDIQSLFITNFARARSKYIKAVYNPETNNVAFAFTDTNVPDLVNSRLVINNVLWMYNVEQGFWYRWPDVPAQSLIVGNDGDAKRFYFGTDRGKIVKTGLSNRYDVNYDDERVAIKMVVATGQINIDGSFYTVKGFKRFLLIYKPEDTHHIQVDVQVDNIPLDSDNSHIFSETAAATLLGVDFILGESLLGSNAQLAPYSRGILGYGRSVKVTITLEAINEFAEIEGFGIEWEPAGTSPEVRVATQE